MAGGPTPSDNRGMNHDPIPRVAAGEWKRIGLIVFLTGVALNAVIAIAVILGAGGDAEWRILGTSLLLTAASIGVIANAAALDRGRLGPLPIVAGASVLVAVGMGIYGIWADPYGDPFYQWMGTFATVGVAGTYAGLIALPSLARTHLWLRWSAVGLAGAHSLAAIISIWQDEAISGELWGVLAVLLAALTIVIPVLARVDRANGVEADNPLVWVAYCPLCGAGVDPTTESPHACHRCGASFTVTVHHPGAQASAPAPLP